MGEARRKFLDQNPGVYCNSEDFLDAAGEVCKFWQNGKRKPKKNQRHTTLSGPGWDKAKMHATELLPYFKDLTLKQCTELMLSRMSINEQLMLGLPERFHVWKKGD